MAIKNLIFVCLGGGLGSMARYLISTVLNKYFDHFPLGTYFANIVGCLLIGVFLGLQLKYQWTQPTILFLVTGFCGGFTTFSTFVLENQQFLKQGEFGAVCFYTGLSFIIGLSLVYFGTWITK